MKPRPLPFVTGDLEGVPGRVKVEPEDFLVDEIPLYLPSGEGEHLFVLVKKRGKDTLWVAKDLALKLGVSPREVGIAGQKDRHAITTQWLSFSGVSREDALTQEGEGYEVLDARLHQNKLRTGHLKGNRFRIRIRDIPKGSIEQIRRIARALEERGFPNFYGSQRFGRSGDNAEVGRRILLGEEEAKGGRRNSRLRKLMISAFQSEIFNRVLASRIENQTWDLPNAGDVVQKLETGGLFVCEEPEVDLPRVRSFECSITGPLPGPKMRPRPSGLPESWEEEALLEAGVPPDRLAHTKDAPGARRPFRLPLQVEVEEEPEASSALLSFSLPAGSYATSLLREITKSD